MINKYIEDLMNITKNIIALICFSVITMRAMDIHQYIEQHKDSPKELANVLIHMGQWEKPDLDAARKILKLGVTANAKDKGNIAQDNPGWAALTTAASGGHTDYVALLIDAGADIEIKDPWDGRTAIMAAALYDHADTVALLLQRGANPNATNCYNKTALIWAASEARLNAVKLLLQAKADVTIRDIKDFRRDKDGKEIAIPGKTALGYAREKGFSQYQDKYDEIIKLLKNAGAQE